MRILLDETAKGEWEISVVPVFANDRERPHDHKEVGRILLGLANNLLQEVLRPAPDKPEKSGKLIQIPRPSLLPPDPPSSA